MKKLVTSLRLVALTAVILATFAASAPQPAHAGMSCARYCKEVCAANGESCYFYSEFSCACL